MDGSFALRSRANSDPMGLGVGGSCSSMERIGNARSRRLRSRIEKRSSIGRRGWKRFTWRAHSSEHDDPQTEIRRIPALLAQERSEDRQAAQSWDVQVEGRGAEARTRG